MNTMNMVLKNQTKLHQKVVLISPINCKCLHLSSWRLLVLFCQEMKIPNKTEVILHSVSQAELNY